MKNLLVLALAIVLQTVVGFQVVLNSRRVSTHLNMGLFDFDAFHGGGSADEEELDEQWETQQAILRARQGKTTKESLQRKYGAKSSRPPPKGAAARPKRAANAPPKKDQPKNKPFWQL